MKKTLLALFLIQILFIALLVFINFKYQTSILQDTSIIIGSLDKANYEPKLIEAGVPFTNSLEILESYERMASNIKKLFLYQALAFLTIGTLLWALTHKLFEKRKLADLWLEMLKRSSLFIFPLMVMGYILLTYMAEINIYLFFIIVSLLFYYFMLVYLSSPYKFLDSVKKAVYKSYIFLPVIIGNLLIVAAVCYLLYISVDLNLFLVSSVILLLVSVLIASRVWLVCIVRRYCQDSSTS